MKQLFLFFTFFIFGTSFSQEHAWVYFNDKPNEATYLANPLTMLSQRALDRRTKQNISLDFKDVPLATLYINQVNAQNGIEVKAESKWLNAVHVIGSIDAINDLLALSFVASVEFAASDLNAKNNTYQKQTSKFDVLTDYNYGDSANQAELMHVEFLHQQNFTGEGLHIAVIDAGFPNVDTFSAFDKIRDNNQILGGYDYVNRDANFYAGHRHGTSVLSTIAGFVDGELIGTAPDASFYLFITEDIASETPLEESLWVEAVERADYLGVDIINTSLGYQAFDESKYNHTYQEMDGNTLFVTRAANIAVSKGMILCISAGNSGNSIDFNNIGAPGIATNAMTIGAIDSNNNIASFSSYGPSSNGDIKPTVNAKGAQATVINSAGNVSTGNGTSYASPIMTGAIASFWQAFPNKTNLEIMQMVTQSAHLYLQPTDHAGYGTPNFKKAYDTELNFDGIVIYPNPVNDIVNFRLQSDYKNSTVNVFDMLGKHLKEYNINTVAPLNLSNFEKGVYVLHFETTTGLSKTIKIIKN
ncbi:MAG: S8 family serine peptidase [Flavobacteriaceae bacterium]